MHRFILILLLLVFIGCGNIQNIRTADTAAGDSESGKLTFMTFNIRASGGMENPVSNPDIVEETKESLTKIAAAINSADPDIVGLQEVRGLFQAKFIAEQLNMNYVYSVHASQIWWGQAVLSKYKIIDVRTKTINLGGKYGDRIALVCTVDINGKKLRVINVDFVPENYKGQVEETLPLLSPLEGPVVLLGDFSRRPEYAKMVQFRESMIATCEAARTAASRCAGTGFGQVDYIFVDPNNFIVLDAGLVSIENRGTSGLKAYSATIKLKGG
jgi:endonuclease/exonuclease/phosphatase family metal-dependent hydrolase